MKGQPLAVLQLIKAKLSRLADVLISGPTNGQVLTYEAASAKWKNKAPTGGAGITPRFALLIYTTAGEFVTNSVLSGAGGTVAQTYYRVQGSTALLVPQTLTEERRFNVHRPFKLKATIKFVRVRGYYTIAGGTIQTTPYVQLTIQKISIAGTRTQIYQSANQNLSLVATDYEFAVDVDVSEDEALELVVKLYGQYYSANGTATLDMYAYSPRIVLDARA